MGRATQGVRLIKLNDDDRISSVEKIQQIVEVKNDASDIPQLPPPSEMSSDIAEEEDDIQNGDDAPDAEDDNTENNNPQ
jgi:DNA gyrase subunit A